MALKDVKKYYLKLQKEYVEGKENMDYMINEFKEGKVNKDTFDNFELYYKSLKENYDKISYIMYLFNVPARDSKKDKYDKRNYNKDMVKYFKDNKVSKEDTYAENEYALTKLREIVREEKENKK